MASIARKSALPVKGGNFDAQIDIVVVGGGAGGLSTALFSRWHGNDVMLLEKADELGGTTRKAAFWYWVPNNEPMQAVGIEGSARRTACATWRGCRARRPTTRTIPRSA